MNKSDLIINIAINQAAWWLCILLGNQALLPLGALLLLHIGVSRNKLNELMIVILCGAIGFSVDHTLTQIGIYVFPESTTMHGLNSSPAWLSALWLAFSTSLNHSLKFFQDNLILAAIVGAVAGPSTYLAASKLGAFSFAYDQILSVSFLALVWAMLFPFLLFLSKKIARLKIDSKPSTRFNT